MINVIASVHGNLHNPCFLAAFTSECVHPFVHLQESFLYSVLCKCFVAKVKIAHIENRFLVLINELFKPLISIRSSVRAHNIAHVMITSYYRVVVYQALFQELCYTAGDAVDW